MKCSKSLSIIFLFLGSLASFAVAAPALNSVSSQITMPSSSTSGSVLAPPLTEAQKRQGLPAHHPSVTESSQSEPGPQVPQPSIYEDPTLSPGVIDVRVLNEKEQPLANVSVTLLITKQSVSEGDQKSEKILSTNADGHTRFEGITHGKTHVYRTTIQAFDPTNPEFKAIYTTPQFNLLPDKGTRIVLYQYPVTSKLEGLLAAVGGVDTLIEVRDDVIEVQQLFEIINASTKTWALGPNGLLLRWPRASKALRSQETTDDQRVVAVDGGVKWLGSFPPGRTRIVYDYKIPREDEASTDFELSLPPRVMAARVRLAARRGMTLSIDGFDAPREEPSHLGIKVLSVVREGSPQNPMHELKIHIQGIPTVGNHRWIATAIAFVAVAVGLWFVFQKKKPTDVLEQKQIEHAREHRQQHLLREFIVLEQAHRQGNVGPTAYSREHERLIDELADTIP